MDRKFTVSLFENVGDTRPKLGQRTWAQLCAKFASPSVREDKDGLLFSPARYSGNRRLQSNVIELSMLVLEIDGAWRCACCRHSGPRCPMFVSNRVRNADGRVDRSPRCPACLKAKCEKCFRKEPKPRTETVLEQIEFSLESVIEGMRLVFPQSAFAIYSTHSHRRITATVYQHTGEVHGHELPEPCYRLIVPLAQPVPVAQFPALWHWAVQSLHEYEVIADPQAKDPNRIFYTPVKASAEVPYEWHAEDGEFFDWQSVLGQESMPLASARPLPQQQSAVVENGPQRNTHTSAARESDTRHPTPDTRFQCHEDLHAELCRRIMARGKQNSQGNYDAKCLAHNGRGNTSLCYMPKPAAVPNVPEGAVFCNAGCGYWEIVVAEGLPELHLPSRQRLEVEASRAANSKLETRNSKPSLNRPQPLTLAQLHFIYAYMLAQLLELSPEHEAQVLFDWGSDPYAKNAEWVPWGTDEEDATHPPRPVKICSMPNSMQIAQAVTRLSELFDLREVPGFYVELATRGPQAPTAESRREHWQSQNFGQWRLNLGNVRKGLLVPRYDEHGFIYAIQIFNGTHDKHPTLLTSRGMPGGAKAMAVREEVAA